MTCLLSTWIAAARRTDWREAVTCWSTTPAALALDLSRTVGAHEYRAPEVRRLSSVGSLGTLTAVGDPFRLKVGILRGTSAPCLVSPQAVLRRWVTRDWHRWEGPGVEVIYDQPGVLSESARSLLRRALGRLRRVLPAGLTSVHYFVPSGSSHRLLVAAEAGPARRGMNSWTDPFGGDVVSRDPCDIHELVHALTNGLPGWPPLALREGLAECFAPTHDGRRWLALGQKPRLSKLFDADPRDVPGWYTASALGVALLATDLGVRGFFTLWDELPVSACFRELARRLSTGPDALESRYRRYCAAAQADRSVLEPGGLFTNLVGTDANHLPRGALAC